MTMLQNPLPLAELSQMLEAALLLQNQKQQTGELEKIVEQLKLSPSSAEQEALKKRTLFELHGRRVESHIRDGIAKLQSECSPTWVSLSSQIVKYRLQNNRRLDRVFDDISNRTRSALETNDRLDLDIAQAAKALQEKAQKLKWTYKNDSWTARAILRECDAQFSKSKDPNKEREQRRQEKLALLIYHLMNELFPILGAGVILIYAAMREQHCYLDEARRDIHDIPGFANFAAKRVETIDISEIKNVAVHFPLAVVGWALGKSFFEICELLRLHSLKCMALNYDKFDEAEEEYLAAQEHLMADQEDAGIRLDRGLSLSFEELQEQAAGEGKMTNHQEHTASLSSMSSSEGPMASLLSSDDAGAGLGGTNECQIGSGHLASCDNPAAQNPACARGTDAAVSNEESLFCPTQPSTDSGYMSNVGSQQWHHATSVTSSSGAFLLPSPLSSHLHTQQGTAAAAGESGGEGAGAAAGQKRPQVEDIPTSKRHRPSAEETAENSDPSVVSDPASTCSTAPRGDTASRTPSITADPAQQRMFEVSPQEEDIETSPSPYDWQLDWGSEGDGIPATSGMPEIDLDEICEAMPESEWEKMLEEIAQSGWGDTDNSISATSGMAQVEDS
ncbi:uncharacterized protein BBA_08968 [Beauveria bassiana ARSEF 2860]|uniref:Uncharacterized protein n=1 Tax=Beauveria bassiana (strain ARSEF 2860) TaxID=655819 RepID=J4KLE1_BEAB2|nr:uncharacterized protein BBA_08968 [Beauveria bassiana ARSEF 2860]EJP62044.1 hypothetical protein BBA_08968 [Beauveria bassiana ARSEF 2860]